MKKAWLMLLCVMLAFSFVTTSHNNPFTNNNKNTPAMILAAPLSRGGTEGILGGKIIIREEPTEEPTEEPIEPTEDPAEESEESEESEAEKEKEEEEEREREREKEEEEKEYEYHVRTSILLIVTFLIVLSIIFEYLKHFTYHSSSEAMKPVVDALFAELTVLGFIALIIFLLTQGSAIDSIGEHVFPDEPEELFELVEQIHFIVFGMMICYILEVILLIKLATKTEKGWRNYEHIVSSKQLTEQYQRQFAKKHHEQPWWVGYFGKRFLSTDEKQYLTAKGAAVYASMRKRFIQQYSEENDEISDNFDFAEYLTLAMRESLLEVIEIHPATWIVVEVFIVIMWALMGGTHDTVVAVSVIFSWFLLAVSFGLEHKLRVIKNQLVYKPKKLSFFMSKSQLISVGEKQEEEELEDMKDKEEKEEKEKIKVGDANAEEEGEEGEESRPPYLNRPPERRSAIMKLLLGRRPANSHEQLFWLDHKGPSFMLRVLCCLLILNSIFLVTFSGYVSQITVNDHGPGILVLILILGYIPLFLMVYRSFIKYMKNLTLTSSIEMLKKEELVDQAIQTQTTKKIVRMLKMINLLRTILRDMKLAEDTMNMSSSDLEGSTHKSHIPDKFKAEIRLVFNLFDTDKSDSISVEEFVEMMQTMGHKTTLAAASKIVSIIDQDKNGSISFNEFANFSYNMHMAHSHHEQKKTKESEEEFLNAAFGIFDHDGSGSITGAEFKKVLKSMEIALSDEDIDSLVAEIASGSGVILKEDFKRMVKKYESEFKHGNK